MNQEEIEDLIEEMTTTGKDDLARDPIHSLYNLSRRSNENLETAYQIVFTQLQQKHSEIRYSAFQIIDKLFMRSHNFRELVINDLSAVFVLTMETDYPECKLPPPFKTAGRLKKMALGRFYAWYTRFGKGYRLLELGFEYLSNVKEVKFDQIIIEQQRDAQKHHLKHHEKVLCKSRIDQVDMQFEDQKTSILSDCREMENCFAMLVRRFSKTDEENTLKPDNNEKDIVKEGGEGAHCNEQHQYLPQTTGGNDVASPGKEEPVGNDTEITSHAFTLQLEIGRKQVVYESPDNVDIIRRTRELYKENQRHERYTKQWLATLTKSQCTNRGRVEEISTLRRALLGLLSKYQDMEIRDYEMVSSDENSEGDEFVEVPEKFPRVEQELLRRNNQDGDGCAGASGSKMNVDQRSSMLPVEDSEVPTCSRHLDNNTSENHQQDESNSTQQTTPTSREKHLKCAPILPFDTDLKYWESPEVDVAVAGFYKLESLHRFWKTNEHQEESFVPAKIDSSKTERCIKLDTKFVPVTRSCGAPMTGGERCERMDREKCPFHGRIVPRDGEGKPIHKDDIERDKLRERQKENADRLKMQREIEARTGIQLTYQKGKRRRNRRHVAHMNRKEKRNFRYARLTKIVAATSATKSRGGNTEQGSLKKKIFSVRSMDKISQVKNQTSRTKHEEQFGSNFNY